MKWIPAGTTGIPLPLKDTGQGCLWLKPQLLSLQARKYPGLASRTDPGLCPEHLLHTALGSAGCFHFHFQTFTIPSCFYFEDFAGLCQNQSPLTSFSLLTPEILSLTTISCKDVKVSEFRSSKESDVPALIPLEGGVLVKMGPSYPSSLPATPGWESKQGGWLDLRWAAAS